MKVFFNIRKHIFSLNSRVLIFCGEYQSLRRRKTYPVQSLLTFSRIYEQNTATGGIFKQMDNDRLYITICFNEFFQQKLYDCASCYKSTFSFILQSISCYNNGELFSLTSAVAAINTSAFVTKFASAVGVQLSSLPLLRDIFRLRHSIQIVYLQILQVKNRFFKSEPTPVVNLAQPMI